VYGAPNFTCALGTITRAGKASVSVTYTVAASVAAGETGTTSATATRRPPTRIRRNNTGTDTTRS
jgi:hypothetical protein